MPSLTKNKGGQRRQTELLKNCIKTGKLCEGYLEDLAGVQLVSLDLWACISGHCDSGSHWVLCKSKGPGAAELEVCLSCGLSGVPDLAPSGWSRLALAAGALHSLPLLPFRPAGPPGSAAPFSALSWSLAWLC